MQQLARTVLRNSAFGMAAQIAVKGLSFLFNLMVIRTLGAADYGQYAAVIGFGTVFLFMADLGLAPYTVREVARLREVPDGEVRIRTLYGNMLALRLILGLVSGLLVVGAAVLTGRPALMVGAVALNALNVLLYAFQGSSEAVLSGYERLDLTAGVRVVNQLVFVLLGAAALALGFGYYGLIVASLAGILVMTWFSWRAASRLGVLPGRPDLSLWRPLLRAAFPFGVIGLTLGLSYRFDSVLINVFWGDVPTGYYNAAYNLVFALVTLSNVLNTALYPSLSRQAVADPAALPRIYERLLRYLLLVALPLAVGGFILAEPLVHLLFGEEYAPAAPLLAVLIWVLPLMFLSEFLGYVVVIAGREGRVARAVIVSSALNVVANLALIPRLGVAGAAAVTLATELVLVCQYLWLLRDLLRQMDWSALLRALGAVAAMAGLVYLARSLPVLLNVALGGSLYGALLLVTGAVGREELAFVKTLLRPRAVASKSA